MGVTPELAELFGAYVGDGTMSNRYGKGALLSIAASKEEGEWLNHAANLFKQIFNYHPKVLWNSNVYKIQIGVNEVCEFFKEAGFSAGEKGSTVKAPKVVIETNDKIIYKSFLKGYFDADGCLCFEKNPLGRYTLFKKTHHYYPRILLTSISKDLILTDIKQILDMIGLRYYAREIPPHKKNEHKSHIATVAGATQIKLWMEEVGSSNPVHVSKYLVWEKFGFCPTKTTLDQRRAMSSGELNPEVFYKK